MSVCTGRTPSASELLAPIENVELSIPVVCFMEAHTTFKATRAAKGDLLAGTLKMPFAGEIVDVGRDPGVHAQEFCGMLKAAVSAPAGADAALVRYMDESEMRLASVMRELAASIIDDAKSNPAPTMAFLTEDGGWELPSLVEAMSVVGIERMVGADETVKWAKA